MDLYSVFVTGAYKGIGLGLVRHLIQLPNPPEIVFATYRSSNGLEALERVRDNSKRTRVIPIKMDVTIKNEIENARKVVEDIVGDRGLTLLVNNAAVIVRQSFPQVTEENLLHHFQTNTIGPIMVVQAFFPLLQKSAQHKGLDSKMSISKAAVLNISAGIGSITLCEKHDGMIQQCLSYSTSKAGLNMSMRTIAADLKKHDVLVVMMCPGWVKTDMGTDLAPLTVDESVPSMLETLEKLDESHHGLFMDRHGNLYEF